MGDQKVTRGWQGTVLKLLGAGDYRLTVTGRREISAHYLRGTPRKCATTIDGSGLQSSATMSPAAYCAQPVDALHDELPHLRLQLLHVPWGKRAGHQLAELGVHRWILHHHRRIMLQPNRFQLAVVDRQALRGGVSWSLAAAQISACRDST
jgi:hypothetical protein